MPYLISNVSTERPQSGFRYLFDANIWLAVLDPTFHRNEYRPYISFFDSIISNRFVSDAVIAIPALLLSEVLNRLLNDVYYEEFQIDHPRLPDESKKKHFKKVYRSHSQYANDLNNACASIRAYHSKIEFVNDNLDQYKCKDLIKKIPTHLDINDYLYSKMALEQGLVIVTNDSDFKVEDIHVLTTQPSLLNLK